jgi:hypothetical protein
MYTSWPFGIFIFILVYFIAIWYACRHFGTLHSLVRNPNKRVVGSEYCFPLVLSLNDCSKNE